MFTGGTGDLDFDPWPIGKNSASLRLFASSRSSSRKSQASASWRTAVARRAIDRFFDEVWGNQIAAIWGCVQIGGPPQNGHGAELMAIPFWGG